MKRILVASNEGNRICEIINPGEFEAPVDPPLFWADAPDGVGFDWVWNGSAAEAPPPPAPPTELEEAREARKLAFEDILEELVDDPKYSSRPLVAAYRAQPGRPQRP